jgi:hypothetical protein
MSFHEDQPHTRCLLGKVMKSKTGRMTLEYRIGWVPTLQAHVGHVLRLRCPDEIFPNGWEVMELFEVLAPITVAPLQVEPPVLRSSA